MEDRLRTSQRPSTLLPAAVPTLHANVTARYRPALYDEARGRWWVDDVRLRFAAVKA